MQWKLSSRNHRHITQWYVADVHCLQGTIATSHSGMWQTSIVFKGPSPHHTVVCGRCPLAMLDNVDKKISLISTLSYHAFLDLDLLNVLRPPFCTHSWLNWVDEDDWWGWGWLKRKDTRYIKIRPEALGVRAKDFIQTLPLLGLRTCRCVRPEGT